MASDEGTLVRELQDDFERLYPGGFCYKLHGGPYQAGLPDLLVTTAHAAALVEAKWASADADWEKPLTLLAAGKLTKQQGSNLAALVRCDGPIRPRLLLGGAFDAPELPGGKAVLAVGVDMAHFLRLPPTVTLLSLASHCVALRAHQPTEAGSPHVYPQIKARGERWNAGFLLLGGIYYGPVKASTDKDEPR